MSWNKSINAFGGHLKLEKFLANSSIAAYKGDLFKLASFYKSQSPTDLTRRDILDFITFLAKAGLSARSQARIISSLKAYFAYLIEESLITQSPMQGIDSPRIQRHLPDVLSYEDIEQLLKGIDLSKPMGHRDKAMIESLYGAGLRASELVSLRLEDLYFDLGVLRVVSGKGNKERLVPIGQSALKALRLYIEHTRRQQPIKEAAKAYVFISHRGRKMSREALFLIVKHWAQQAQIKQNVSPHTFRHSFATHLIEGGADLRAVQTMLGHASITTTELYTHLDKNYLKQMIQDFHPRS